MQDFEGCEYRRPEEGVSSTFSTPLSQISEYRYRFICGRRKEIYVDGGKEKGEVRGGKISNLLT